MQRTVLPLALVLSACAIPPKSPSQEDQTNIVILFADDMGWGDLSSYGNPVIRTPQLDRMAQLGMRFTDFHSASPACSASRYGLLTGRYPHHSGFGWVLFPGSKEGLAEDETTMAEALQARGYATAVIGKWHLGDHAGVLPLDHGFDEYFGLPYSNDMLPSVPNRNYPPIPLYKNKLVAEYNPDQSTLTRRYTEYAVEFIHRNRDRPFFLYVPYAMPHVPLHPGEEFAGKSPRGIYGDVVEELDWSAGVIAKALSDCGVAEKTLFIFTSDNGPWIIKGENGGSSGPLMDGKGSSWEGGHRVPALAWWPGTIPAGSICRELASTLDLLPTALDMSAISETSTARATKLPLDGRSLLPLMTGGAWQDERIMLIHGPGNEIHGIRKGRWKLLVKTNSQTGVVPHEGKVPLLFDLQKDPGERRDVSENFPEVLATLQSLLPK
ncbi:MAG TPA: sulfatase [Planctomycetota bacterium]|nr:arylsulfatase [Planctomycetota bacterium]MDP6129220.1 sulfatase [Planctomycetota bacterium]MDP7559640.1 sulfatase [Planctomycetota bacterium]HJM38498.1 sulfatase [Planctomycetota bacterium]|tara:strand:+ start:33295 stop:34608 length:1314 start_codon:yes stop_codon:yes gene_type:complete